jgi:Spy/CpxP family protein refolding chaperone
MNILRSMRFSNPERSLDMTHMNLRKAFGAAALIGASLVTANVMADPPQGPYYQGYGMGPGMMGGYGMGPGMMAPGMMPYGRGPGMMGPGRTGGYGVGAELNLTEEQRSQIAEIQNALRQKYLELMGKMQEEQFKMRELYTSENRDDTALSNGFRNMLALRQEMFDELLSVQKQVSAVLTEEQREILKGK